MRKMLINLGLLCIWATGALAHAGAAQSGVAAAQKPVVANVPAQVMQSLLIHQATIAYPHQALAAGISGTVILGLIIDQTGHVAKVQAVAGPELLRQAAVDAVRQYVYKPYLLNGKPTIVETAVTLNFRHGTQPADGFNPPQQTYAPN